MTKFTELKNRIDYLFCIHLNDPSFCVILSGYSNKNSESYLFFLGSFLFGETYSVYSLPALTDDPHNHSVETSDKTASRITSTCLKVC